MNKLINTTYLCLLPLIFLTKITVGQTSIDSLRLIGQKHINPGVIIKGTTFGGISGIDRKPDGEYVLISDDRSEYSPARYYIADIKLSEKEIDSVIIKDVRILKTPDAQEYPARTLDPESIRYKDGHIYWTSEGSRKDRFQPFIRVSDTSGTFTQDIPLEKKFRNNLLKHAVLQPMARDSG